MVIYAMQSAYRINYFISAIFLILALPLGIMVAFTTLSQTKKPQTKKSQGKHTLEQLDEDDSDKSEEEKEEEIDIKKKK